MKVEIGAYITIITAIVAAFITYRNQLRLKAFELFLARRDSVLKDIEKFIERLYVIQYELSSKAENNELERYKNDFHYEGLILYHKIRGANFGELISVFLETFYAIIDEPVRKDLCTKIKKDSTIDIREWISRTLNAITALYAFAHSEITKEVENMAFSYTQKIKRRYSGKIKIEKPMDKKK